MKSRVYAVVIAGLALVSCTSEGIHDPVASGTEAIVIEDVGPVSSQDGITFTLDPDEGLTPGEVVTLILRNDTGNLVGYNLCLSSFLVRSGAEWRSMPTHQGCTLMFSELPAGAEVRYDREVPASLESGTYRFWTVIRLMTGEGPEVPVFTPPFDLDQGPLPPGDS
jgi:hypothetical protein